MEYPLDLLDDLVSELIELSGKPAGSFNETSARELLHALTWETAAIQNGLVKQIFQISRAKEIERFIQNYQAALTNNLDRLYRHEILLARIPDTLRLIFDGFYRSILTLLSFVEERFSKYFDAREKVPDVYFVLTALELEAEGKIIFSTANPDAGDRAVMDLLAAGYQRFLNNGPRQTISYSQVIYRKMLLKELRDLQETNGSHDDG